MIVVYGYDIAVVGGGPAGLLTALMCASLDARVVVVEQRSGLCNSPGTAPRVAQDSTRRLLISVDPVFDELLTRHSQTVSSVSFYRSNRAIRTLDSGSRVPLPLHCFQSSRFCRALLNAVRRNRSIRSMLRTEVIGISPADGLLRIRGARYDRIKARYIIVADGAASKLRSALSIPFHTKRYHEAFLVSTPVAGNGRNGCEIHIHRNGIALSLPVSDNLVQWFLQIDRRIGVPDRMISSLYAGRIGSETDTIEQEIRYRTGRKDMRDEADGGGLLRVQSARAGSLRTGQAFLVGDAAYRIPGMSGIDFDHLCSDASLIAHSTISGECVDRKRKSLLYDTQRDASRISGWIIGRGWHHVYRTFGLWTAIQ